MNIAPTHALATLHEEAGNNKFPNVADREAMSEPAGLMPTPATTHSL